MPSPLQTNSVYVDEFTTIEIKVADFKKLFIQLYHTGLEGDNVTYSRTNHSDVLFIIQTTNQHTDRS